MIPQFRISTVLLFVLVIAVATAWLADRKRLIARIQSQNPPISHYWEKHGYWSPSIYFGVDDTSQYESLLSGKVQFTGPMVESSQGMTDATLRQPNDDTIDSTVGLLSDDDRETQLTAARLLALYLQGSSGSDNIDTNSIAVRVRFHATGLQPARDLLCSKDPRMRSAAALILGNTLYDKYTVRLLKEAFDRETNDTAKLHLAWAYWRLSHNYPRTDWYLKQKAARIANAAEQNG